MGWLDTRDLVAERAEEMRREKELPQELVLSIQDLYGADSDMYEQLEFWVQEIKRQEEEGEL